MGLSPSFVQSHIDKWEARLDSPNYPHRKKWPSRLFHHSPLDNAIEIIRDGNLRSRSDPDNPRIADVAACGVIDTRSEPHSWARLYFRPKTPTQYHIEGIRRAGECRYGENAHAPVLYMFVFAARQVLTRSDVCFCDRNMQISTAIHGDSENYFSNIPFDKVYHEGMIGGDRSIIEHRCAEVLSPSPLPLNETLQWIYCRSEAERATLLYRLGNAAYLWRERIRVSDDLKVFQRDYTFVEDVEIASDGVVFQLNPRLDRQKVNILIEARNLKGALLFSFASNMAARPDLPAKRWKVNHNFSNGRYHVRITLEGFLAFERQIWLGPLLV
jgi:hypothetical protein